MDMREFMQRSWALARTGARRWGGEPRQYIRASMRIVAAEMRSPRRHLTLTRVAAAIALLVLVLAQLVPASREVAWSRDMAPRDCAGHTLEEALTQVGSVAKLEWTRCDYPE